MKFGPYYVVKWEAVGADLASSTGSRWPLKPRMIGEHSQCHPDHEYARNFYLFFILESVEYYV